jgi:hypothetical protein
MEKVWHDQGNEWRPPGFGFRNARLGNISPSSLASYCGLGGSQLPSAICQQYQCGSFNVKKRNAGLAGALFEDSGL